MRCIFIFFALFPFIIVSASGAATTPDVNGEMAEFENGVRVLRLWGTNYEMGFAHGYLLAPEILRMMEIYAFPPPDTGTWLYDWARGFVLDHFMFPDEYVQEAQGIYDGMIEAGVETFVTVLGRNFDVEDIITFSGLSEVTGLFCTTLIGWNTATDMDAVIDGELVVGHNTDYVMEPEDAFYQGEKGVVFVYHPDDENKQPFINITYPGFMGLVIGVNASGLGLMINRGQYETPYSEWDFDPPMAPGVWYSRQALASRDANHDGVENIHDLIAFYGNIRHFSSFLVQVFGPKDDYDPPTATMEINNTTRAIRYPADDPNFAPDIMITLNWEDELLPQRAQNHEIRYQATEYAINDMYGGQFTRSNLWSLLKISSGKEPDSITAHTTMILPKQRKLAVSLWSSYENVPANTHTWFDYDELFMYLPGDDDADDDTASPDDDDDDDVNDDLDDDADDDIIADDDQGDASDSDGNDSKSACGC